MSGTGTPTSHPAISTLRLVKLSERVPAKRFVIALASPNVAMN